MKDTILGWLFADYKRRLDEDLMLEKRLLKASGDIKDIVRERLKGIRPGHPEENSSAFAGYIASLETPERLDFLSKLHAVSKNKPFEKLCEHLMSEAMRKATLEATDIVDVNFQRATINGLQLLEEELAHYAGIYLEEKKAKDVMTPEDSHSVI